MRKSQHVEASREETVTPRKSEDEEINRLHKIIQHQAKELNEEKLASRKVQLHFFFITLTSLLIPHFCCRSSESKINMTKYGGWVLFNYSEGWY